MTNRKELILFALGIALVAIILKYLEYGLAVKSVSNNVYIAILALIFMVMGLWLGRKWTKPKEEAGPNMKKQETVFDPHQIQKLGLSKREQEVLDLLVKGLSNQEIADQLFISLSTVKTHVSNLFSKLDVRRRTQAIQRAKELGLF